MSVLQIHSQSHTHSPATLVGTPWCTTLTRNVWTLEVCSWGSQRLFEACPLWPLTPAINKAISSTCPPLTGFFSPLYFGNVLRKPWRQWWRGENPRDQQQTQTGPAARLPPNKTSCHPCSKALKSYFLPRHDAGFDLQQVVFTSSTVGGKRLCYVRQQATKTS